jgi:hypothetical protein
MRSVMTSHNCQKSIDYIRDLGFDVIDLLHCCFPHRSTTKQQTNPTTHQHSRVVISHSYSLASSLLSRTSNRSSHEAWDYP